MISSKAARFTLTVFMALTSLCIQAQTSGKVKRADKMYARYAYVKALELYEKAVQKDATNPHIVLRIADCYRQLYVPEQSEGWYREALFYPENKDDLRNYLHFIQALMNNGKYDEAGDWVEKYLRKSPGDRIGLNLREACSSYPIFLKDSTLIRITNLDINSEESDFGPTMYEGKVVFSSSVDKDRLVFGWNGQYFLQLYTGTIQEGSVQLEDVERFRSKVNTKFHEAIVTFTPEKDVMYFTRNNFFKGKRGMDEEGATLLKLFRAERDGDNWGKVEGLWFNSDHYSVGHPSLSADGQTLYFTSDMPGGYGGTDIYMSQWEGEDWGKPVNCGETVNTAGTEMFPWISPENVLHFASNGHPGLGGLDIFTSKVTGTEFSEPVNFGAPINSTMDDFQLVLGDDKSTGYFSSNRRGGQGDDDIYSFLYRNIKYKGLVVDKLTQEPIEKAMVQMSDDEKVRYHNFTGPDGLFAQGIDSLYPWEIFVAAEGYQVEKVKLTDAAATDDGLFAKIELVYCGDAPQQPDTSQGPVVTLSGVLKDKEGNPVKKGKVRIIREIDVDDAKFNTVLDPNTDYIVEVESPEYPGGPKVYDISTNTDDNRDIPLEAIFDRDELPPGRVFYIIYYDFDMYNIREPDARPELDRVVSFMKAYPEVTVELGSHTDSRGTFQYNEVLSKNRAVSAHNYITARGIDKDRLTFRWYGERELAVPCPDGVECSEPDHQLNRRTEFKIKGWENGFRSWQKEE